MRPIDRSRLSFPCRVVQVPCAETPGEDDEQLDVDGYSTLLCVIRRPAAPPILSFWDVSSDLTVPVAELRAAAGEPPMETLDVPAQDQSSLTVAICTRNRPAQLQLTLESLGKQTSKAFDILVIDNAPPDHRTREVVERFQDVSCRYIVEPTPGLSHARNRAVAELSTELVAWLDDDELADPEWISMLRSGFGHPSKPDVVCGVMLPAELETEAQVRFEQYGGFNKGRDFTPVVLERGTASVRNPLYPLPNFGAGGNMAFRVAPLRALRGFDTCLGAGTLTHGGEETQVMSRLLLSGSRILHWPQAVTWHYHRKTMAELEAQFFGYAAGLSAFYMSMLRTRPAVLGQVLLLVPQGLSDIRRNRSGGRTGGLPPDFPPNLLVANRRGLLRGGPLYVRQAIAEVRRARRA